MLGQKRTARKAKVWASFHIVPVTVTATRTRERFASSARNKQIKPLTTVASIRATNMPIIFQQIGKSGPHYHDLPDDGADHKCKECGREGPAYTFFLTCTPDGTRAVMCKKEFSRVDGPSFGECIDEGWLAIAKYRGMFRDGED